MTASKLQPNPYLDRAAMWLSGLCLVHCLALPFAMLLAPTLSHWVEATETTTHWILFGIAIPISLVAFVQGLSAFAQQSDTPTRRLGFAADAGSREPCFWAGIRSGAYRRWRDRRNVRTSAKPSGTSSPAHQGLNLRINSLELL